MEAKAPVSDASMVPVAKRDLVEAWSVLEKVVVSLRKIGSAFATPSAQDELTPEQRAQMLQELDRFLSPGLMRELTRARRVLVGYLPDNETEWLSENVIHYWELSGSDGGDIKAE